MSERATRLHQLADGQLSELTDLLSVRAEAALRLACPGREKLGDGTVAACASHTADNYVRIAAFLRARTTSLPRTAIDSAALTASRRSSEPAATGAVTTKAGTALRTVPRM